MSKRIMQLRGSVRISTAEIRTVSEIAERYKEPDGTRISRTEVFKTLKIAEQKIKEECPALLEWLRRRS